MLGRITVVAALAALVCLLAAVKPEQADAQSRVAATAAHSCSVIAATRHRGGTFRGLSSAQTSKAQNYCQRAQRHISRLDFWYAKKHRWTLYLNQDAKKCWQLHLSGPLALCMKARSQVRSSLMALTRISSRLRSFLPWVDLLRQTNTWRQCIITGESRTSGLYRAENGGTRYVEGNGHSDASGAYQFLDSTWRTRFAQAKAKFSWLAGDWSHAADAPALVQDVVAAYVVAYHAGADWVECR